MANNNAPTFGTSIGGAVSLTELQSEYLFKRAWTNQVLLSGDAIPDIMSDLMQAGNLVEGGTNLRVMYSIERDRRINGFPVNAVVAPAINATQTVVVAANGYAVNTGMSNAFKGAIVRYPNSATGRITNRTAGVTNDVLTIEPVGQPQLPALAQGDYLMLMSEAVGEANIPETSYISTDVWAARHGMQTIDAAWTATDFKFAFDQNGALDASMVSAVPSLLTGGNVDTWFSIEFDEWCKSQEAKRNATLLFGQTIGTGGPNTLADGENILGFIPALQAGGQQFIAPSGAYTTPDIRRMVRAFNADGVRGKKHRMWLGNNLADKMDDYLLSLTGQDTRQGTGNDTYNFGYKKITSISGHDFEYTRLDALSDPRTIMPQHGMEDIGIVIPDAMTADTLDGKKVPLMQLLRMNAWKGIAGGLGGGAVKFGFTAGISNTMPGQPVTSAAMADRLTIQRKESFMTVYHQLYRFALIQ